MSAKVPRTPSLPGRPSLPNQQFRSGFFLFARWEKPRFQDCDAKEYLFEYDSFVDQFKYAYRALKAGNIAVYQRLFGSAADLQAKATLLGSRLSAEDQKRLNRYRQVRAVELSQ